MKVDKTLSILSCAWSLIRTIVEPIWLIELDKVLNIYPKNDHRIAMSFFCLAQLINGNIKINNFETVNTSFSKFLITMKKIGAGYEIKK